MTVADIVAYLRGCDQSLLVVVDGYEEGLDDAFFGGLILVCEDGAKFPYSGKYKFYEKNFHNEGEEVINALYIKKKKEV
jgi:hypothetical protein